MNAELAALPAGPSTEREKREAEQATLVARKKTWPCKEPPATKAPSSAWPKPATPPTGNW